MKRVLILVMLIFWGVSMYSQRIVMYPDQVSTCYFHDKSPALRDKPIVAPEDVKKMYPSGIVPNNFERRKYRQTMEKSPDAVDPVVQHTMGVKQVQTGLVSSFDGMTRSQAGGATPPDCSGDVGPNHYVQMINLAFQVFNKQGGSIYGPVSNNVLFDGWDDGEDWDNTNDGDPIVLYDDQADRWLISHFSLPNWGAPYYMLVAYSVTPDPTGEYYRYAFQLNNFPDYPKLSIWHDGVYITFNSNTGQAAVFERDSMLVGAPARMVQFSIPDYPGGSFRSALFADCDGEFPPAGTPEYLMYYNDNSWGSYPTDHLRIWEMYTNWTTPTSSTLQLSSTLVTEAFDSNFTSNWNDISQPGNQKLDALAQAMMFRLQYRRFPNHESILCNYVVDVNGANQAGIRWYELRKETTAWSIYQQGTYAPDSHSRWNASMSMDKNGNIGMAYSVSSSTVYPSLRFTGQTNGAPLGVMDIAETTIIAGTGSQSGTERFGDYATMGVDPIDDMTFWFNSEYIPTGGSWKTRIATFRFDDIIIPDVNASPSALLAPQTSVNLGNAELIAVTLENLGLDTILSLPVQLWIDDTLRVSDTITTMILPQTPYEHTFSITYDFSAERDYMIQVITGLVGDTIPEDDTLSIVIQHLEPFYCDAAGAAGGEYISLVQFKDSDYICASAAYLDKLSDTLVMKQGGNYDFSVTGTNTDAANQLLMWCDWNMDKDFEESNEAFDLGNGPGPYSLNLTVPLDATIGEGRVRIRLHDTQNGPNNTPCGVSTYGSVVDFLLKVVDPLSDHIIIPNEIDLLVYPNPSVDEIKISLPSLSYDTYIQMIDVSGKEIYRKDIKAGQSLQQFQIPLQDIANGMYFVRLRLTNHTIIKVEKFIKQ